MLLVRATAALTVVLSVALMGVSAYAAKGSPPTATSAVPLPIAPDDAVPPTHWLPLVSGADAAQAVSDVSAAVVPPQTSRPAPTFRYPAPEEARSVTGVRGRRDDARSRPRVWDVISIKPGLLSTGGFAATDVPPEQLAVMQQVAGWSGVPWQVLAAIAKVESDFGRNMATSSAGAIGYGQFLPEQWQIYGNGGNAYDFRDALPAMARYLIVAGIDQDLAQAIYAYNHSWEYVALVLSYAVAYGYGPAGSEEGLIWPAIGPISSYFGPGHPLGIDIDLTAVAGAAVWAAHDGRVIFAGGDPCCSYGRFVVLLGPSGIATLYAHLEDLAVEEGASVARGQALGASGCTGHCTAPHLHFEVFEDGVRQDPLRFLPAAGIP
jgi:murein DD-endopeptidase MepM/ murein hydrolase activator NlpD